jgi:RING finger protein 121
MILTWLLFTSYTGFLISKASQSPIAVDTPKRVYGWFFLLYRLCYGLAVFGYVVLMLAFLGLSRLAQDSSWMPSPANVGTMMIFYGLYFGVLGRDCAEMCTDRVASKMGYTGKGLPSKGVPPNNTCCICGERYESVDACELSCKHQFHERCLRGWTMIGKKNTCPFCSEKVEDLTRVFKNPWDRPGIMWANLLDSLRYLIVWNPIILTTVQVFLYLVDPGA